MSEVDLSLVTRKPASQAGENWGMLISIHVVIILNTQPSESTGRLDFNFLAHRAS